MRRKVISRRNVVDFLKSTGGKFFSVRFKRMQEFGPHESINISCRIGVKRPRNDDFALHAIKLFDPKAKLITVFDTNASYRNCKFKGAYRSFYLQDVEEVQVGNTTFRVKP